VKRCEKCIDKNKRSNDIDGSALVEFFITRHLCTYNVTAMIVSDRSALSDCVNYERLHIAYDVK